MVAESVPHIVWMASPGGSIDYLNHQAKDYAGWSHEGTLDDAWLALLHPDDVAVALRTWRHATQTETAFSAEYRLRRADGEFRWHCARGRPMRDAEGVLTGWVCTATDIDDDRRSAGALTESGDRLAEAQRLARVGSWSIYVATERHIWSDELYRLLGYEAQEFAPATERFFDRLHPADASRMRDAVLGQLSRREASEEEFRVVLPSDEVRWLIARTEPLLGGGGEVVGVHGTVQDITESKRSEQQLKFQADLLDAVGEAVIAVDLDGTVIYWGPGAEELYGWPAEDAQSQSIMDMIPTVHGGHDAAEIMGARAEGERWAGTMELRRRDGSTFHAEITRTPVFDDAGTLVGLIGTSSDVSELRRATDETREIAERLTTTIESITDGFCTVDRDWRITYVNQRADEILQRRLTQAVGRDFWEEFPELVGTEVADAYNRALRDGTTEVLEAFLNPVLSSWFAIRVYPSSLGITVFFEDITEQHLADQVVRDRETRLAELGALLDEVSDAVIVSGLDHRIGYWNRSAERIYGWTAEEAVGRSIRDLLYRDPAAYDEAVARLLVDGQWHGELAAVTKRGSELIADCRDTLARDADGRPTRVVGIKTDVTARRRRDSQHWRAQRLESIGTLAGGLAHDLNNALTPVMMATDLLQKEETDRSRLGMLDTIASGTRRATEMVQQILAFAAGVEGRQLPVDIDPLLRDVERIANDTFLKSIRIVRQEATELWRVSGDPTQLKQVLINLCVNARDAMPHGGTLVLAADVVVVDEQNEAAIDEPQPGLYVRIRVEDDGEGMAPEVLDRIFEPFYTTKPHGYGTGLGLSTSAGIIGSHGGFLRVESTPGKGTRFFVHLPVATDAPTAPPDLPPVARREGNGELVLVVDDEVMIRRMLRRILTGSGYRVLEAPDGPSAVSLLTAAGTTVDLVLTDMMMPGMDGLETVRAVRVLRPDVPVILVSGLHTQSMIDEAAELGVRHVLAKPFMSTTLLDTLHEILAPTR